MTREETTKILSMCKTAYPNSYANMDRAEMYKVIDLWEELLREYTARDVAVACRVYIQSDNSGFAPTVGQIIGLIKKQQTPYSLQDVQALVLRAASNSTYHYREEWARLPMFVQNIVGSAGELYRMARLDTTQIKRQVKDNYNEVMASGVNQEQIGTTAANLITDNTTQASID